MGRPAFCHRPGRLLLVVGALACIGGCSSVATKKKFYEPITAELRSGNYSGAAAQLEQAKEKKKYAQKDRLIYFIDAGLANHYAGDYATSNAKLTLAEAAAEELFTKSVSRAMLSMVLNDNTLEYAGEDYEVLYTNLIMALNYIALRKFDDAFVEIRRANEKLDVLERKYTEMARDFRIAAQKDTSQAPIDYQADKVRYYNNAFARYLSMHMYAAEGKADDARIDYDLLVDAFESQPHIYDFEMPDVKTRSEDAAVLSVIGLAGLAPVKEALSLRLRTDKQLKLVQILYDDPKAENPEYGHLPIDVKEDFYFKFAIPQMVERPSAVNSINVYADGRYIGELKLIEDVTRVAVETFQAKKSLIYLRTVARALAKGLANYKAKKKADTGGLGGWLKKAAIDVATDLTENADLRTAQFLPGRIYVGDFEIEPGTYDISAEFLTIDGMVIHRQHVDGVKVTPGNFNPVEVFSLN
ncbi:MAG: hypothetical protein OEW00_13695 [candidate division Zixibacteria bacterium]|nr:hypothetical protein [candidate division Zixibacteria bacterium]